MRLQNLMHLFTISLVLFALISCEYNDYPDAIWDPNDAGETTPTIVSMDPASLAFEGITKVTITGLNYSSVLTENQVTFNGVVAEIDPDNFAAGSLVVTVPVIIADAELNALDSVQVIVAVQGAYAGATYSQAFRVERAVIEWGGFVGEQPAKNPNAVACDANENIYVAAADKIMYKIDTNGERTAFGTGLSSVTNDLKVGPGGDVYFARNIPYVYRIAAAGGAADRWHRVGSKIACFDFDENKNIYCGGLNDSLYAVNVTNETNRGVALAVDYSYVALKVYDGYVYVAGKYDGADASVTVTQGIWRHQILANGDLGAKELVYDWANYSYGASQDIQTLAVNAAGLFYIGVSAGDGPAIINLDITSGDVEAFYDAVLTAPATRLVWGNNTYVYLARYNATATDDVPNAVFRISQTELGAPDYGRD